MTQSRFALAWRLTVVVLHFVFAAQLIEAAPPGKVDVLIGFKNPPGQNDQAFIRAQGGKVKHSYTLIPSIAATVPQQALIVLANNPNVLIIEPDVEIQAISYVDEIALTWGVDRIEADYAHLRTSPITGELVKVAVIDTGIDTDHPDLETNYYGGSDFVNGDSDPEDDNGHGTHCAGTIAGVANGVGVVGVAPLAEIYALKVLDENGSGSFSSVIAALQWCVENGIDVTSNSYSSSQDPGTQVAAAFANANQAGVLSIAAAGNRGNIRGNGNNVGYPAAYDDVVAVAATDQSDNRAYFSSTGPAVEVSAPGYQVPSTYLSGQYAYLSGTSMACPHVAGMAALLIQAGLEADVEIDNEVIRQAIADSCEDLGKTGRDSQYGYGIVNVMAGIMLLESGLVVPPIDTPTEPPGELLSMSVSSIDYSTAGGKNKDKDLVVTLQIDGDSGGVPNASVSITLKLNDSNYASGSGTTDSSGSITFRLRNASNGIWTTVVTNVTADGYQWDNVTPPNQFSK